MILFILQPKVRELKKQTIRNEWKYEKTKARRHDHSWASAELFPARGNVNILFIIFKFSDDQYFF